MMHLRQFGHLMCIFRFASKIKSKNLSKLPRAESLLISNIPSWNSNCNTACATASICWHMHDASIGPKVHHKGLRCASAVEAVQIFCLEPG